MGKTTQIEWCTRTWNPWQGCRKVSIGCLHCYMYRDKERYGQDPTKPVRSKTTFKDPLKWHEPAKVFTCSWSDFFIEEADEWRDEAWAIIKQTPHLTYQILTKRPERMAGRLPWGDDEAPWPNVHIGVSVENQEAANKRIPILANTRAAVKFLSCEPLLGPVDLVPFLWRPEPHGQGPSDLRPSGSIHWAIVGGESGPGCRSMELAWARLLRDQCKAAGVAFFFKQLGGVIDHGGKLEAIPEDLRVREFPVSK